MFEFHGKTTFFYSFYKCVPLWNFDAFLEEIVACEYIHLPKKYFVLIQIHCSSQFQATETYDPAVSK